MSHKRQSKIFKGFPWLVALLALLIWWLFWTDKQPIKTNTTPNQVINQTTNQHNSQKPASDQKKPPSHTVTPSEVPITVDHDLTYLQLYRMHRRWQTCADVIYSLENEDEAYSPVNQLQLKINSHHSQQTNWPTSTQIESIQRHIKRCTQLMHRLSALDLPPLNFQQRHSKHKRIDARLLEHLKNTAPVTKKERAIANVLASVSAWHTTYYEATKTTEEYPILQQQTTPEYLENMLGTTHEQTTSNNISNNQMTNIFSFISEQLSQQLYTSDPDVFYEAQTALEQSNGMDTLGYFTFKRIGQIKNYHLLTEYISPGEVLMQLAGLHDGEWFDLTIQYATNLYLCELGADCSPDSELIGLYCYAGLLQLDPVSCDLDYPAFLQSHYLNDNQWDDVQHMLSLIRDLYAKK